MSYQNYELPLLSKNILILIQINQNLVFLALPHGVSHNYVKNYFGKIKNY